MKTRSKQQGFALFLIAILLATAAATVTVKALKHRSGNIQIARDRITANALAQAKDALIGRTVSQSLVTSAGYLNLPDIGSGVNYSEGNAAGDFSENNADYSVIGKMPWKTLGISPSRNGQGECLWYVVSGRFKNTPQTGVFNWDTQGQIDVNDGNGNPIASNVAALLVAPGRLQAGQNRAHDPADTQYIQCGGNYDTSNYLNSYFNGSTNNRVALNANNKPFTMTNNDRFLLVTIDDIFRPIIQRSDFRDQITALMNDTVFIPHLQSVAIAGKKGTNSVDCDNTDPTIPNNKIFCTNWKEMLLLTNLHEPSNMTIISNGIPATTGPCTRVLIFGGQKTTGQARITNTDKNNPDNYLEAPNRAAFDTPTAHSGSFSGFLTFDAKNPGHDLLRCIP
ncbi:MAG: hypothetical protein Q7T38_06570 [Gallionella sp.]|nr:hypothetical protein [Gallionella sp.]